jgi:hypothetical protein
MSGGYQLVFVKIRFTYRVYMFVIVELNWLPKHRINDSGENMLYHPRIGR